MRWLPLTLGLLAYPALASAQPMDTYGMGSRSIALGGAVTADVEDWTANYYNPAGVVRDDQLRIGFGWFAAAHDLSLNDIASNVDPVHGIVVGLNVPGNFGDFRFAFGLGLHFNDQRVSRTRTLPRGRPRWEFYNNRPHRTYIATHLAIEPVPWLRFGGGIGFLSTADVDLRIRGTISLAATERLSALEHDLVGNLETVRFPQLGVQVQPTDWLDFGAVYRGEYALSTELTAEIGEAAMTGPNSAALTAGDLVIPAFLGLTSASVGAYVPHQISVGASVRPIETLRISVEVTWLMWSLYRSPFGPAVVDIRIDIPPELSDSIVIPTVPPTTTFDVHFSDRAVPRVGVEWDAFANRDLHVDLRVGYFYENTPIPEQTGAVSLVDTDRHAWTVGAGLELSGLRPLLPGSLRLDIHLQYAWLPPRTTRKDSIIDPVGDFVADLVRGRRRRGRASSRARDRRRSGCSRSVVSRPARTASTTTATVTPIGRAVPVIVEPVGSDLGCRSLLDDSEAGAAERPTIVACSTSPCPTRSACRPLSGDGPPRDESRTPA